MDRKKGGWMEVETTTSQVSVSNSKEVKEARAANNTSLLHKGQGG